MTGGVTGKGFQKGKSGNPGGRPKGAAELGRRIRDFLATKDPKDKKNRWRLDILIERLADEDPRILLAYAFGKPLETHKILAAEQDVATMDVFGKASDEQLRQIIGTEGMCLIGERFVKHAIRKAAAQN